MEPLKIKQKIEDMIAYAYIVLAQFPKSEKHTLAAEIKKSMFRLLELVIACNKKYFKKTTMQELDVELDMLRSYVRLAVTLKFIPLKKYEIWAGYLTEIGKMIGGWMKSIRV
jgi:hypothetical protein